uniref:Guided entry of tail-anchored proteins factor 1 n=1 Tax=Plectus sambesii TaxID=2011161 RepID=A0A914W2N7_9BILA
MSQPQGAEDASLFVAASTTFQAVTTLFYLLLVAFSTNIIQIIAPRLINLITRSSTNDAELQTLTNDLTTARKELLAISPVAEFAKYAKKQRIVNALEAKVKGLSGVSSSKTLKQRIAVQVFLYAIVYIFTLYLLYTNYGIAVAVFDSRWLYPLNWVVSFPGCSSNAQQTGVSVQFCWFMVMAATKLTSLKSK